MKVAVIGSGLAGLATAWHLLQKGVKVTVYAHPTDAGASHLAAGLLHPFAGAHAKLNWKGEEGFLSSLQLMNVVAKETKKPVYWETGIIRPAVTNEQQEDFKACAAQYPNVEWMDNIAIEGIKACPGILIKQGCTVDTSEYLNGLRHICNADGVTFMNQKVKTLKELNHFDRVVICAGAHASEFPELEHLKLRRIKGQLIELSIPQYVPLLPCPLNSRVYILKHPQNHSYIVGATFERSYETEDPRLETAAEELLPLAYDLFPALKESTILSCKSAVRGAMPNHRPHIGHVKDNIWAFCGLGSKGLLYHALFAEELATLVVDKSTLDE